MIDLHEAEVLPLLRVLLNCPKDETADSIVHQLDTEFNINIDYFIKLLKHLIPLVENQTIVFKKGDEILLKVSAHVPKRPKCDECRSTGLVPFPTDEFPPYFTTNGERFWPCQVCKPK